MYKAFIAILFTYLLVFTSSLRAFTQSVLIKGVITNSNGKGVTNAYVKVASTNNKLVLAYTNTGNDSTFNINITNAHSDSIRITITHVNYEKYEVVYATPSQVSITIKATLLLKVNNLEGITIKAPPVWQRGDTTFHRASAFKEGDERQLKDLLLKLPDFEVKDDGTLLYKKKPVEKIMIDGEEIMADKVNLLINNLPIHVIDVVQALENQNKNTLLKGLKNENRVFLNLTLNKAKLKAAFGSGEVGGGTNQRYYINPVLFSIYGKIKMGYIGNFNSIGKGIGTQEYNESQPAIVRNASDWLMNGLQLATINNFNNERYIRNKQFSNNFQVTLPATNRLKQKLEFANVTDQQNQETFYTSTILNNNLFVSRTDTNLITNKPSFITITYSNDYQANSNSRVNTFVQYYRNNAINQQQSIASINNDPRQFYNSIGNNWHFIQTQVTYTKRVHSNKAYVLNGSYSFNNNIQLANSFSADWPTIFQLPATYSQLQQGVKLTNQNSEFTIEQATKRRNNVKVYHLKAHWQRFSVQNNLLFKSNNASLRDTSLSSFANNGVYDFFRLSSNYQQNITIATIPLSVKVKAGVFAAQRHENSINLSYIFPEYEAEIMHKFYLGKKARNYFQTSFSMAENALPEYQQTSILFSRNINNFTSYKHTSSPIKTIKLNTIMAFSIPKAKLSTLVQFEYEIRNRNPILTSNLQDIIQFTTDSFIRKPLQSFSFTINNNIENKKRQPLGSFGIGANINENLILITNRIKTGTATFLYTFANSKFNIRKKYFASASLFYTITSINFSQTINNSNNRNAIIKALLRQRVIIGKNANIILSSEWYNGDIGGNKQATLFFTDAEFNIGFPKKHLTFYVKALNLANQKFYTNANVQVLQQSLYQVPLVGIHGIASVKYDL
ncbi:MAG TPA: hypothetical protein DCL43_14335 [Chitinophagaceae bacterium]|nr:hypothetical protein [Chitinophagaceae bacterium]HAN40103.1 hypothetical protein [Chitinophagaceae bacterium]